MFASRLRAAAATALLAVVVGCALGTSRVVVDLSSSYDFGNFRVYHEGRDTRVQIHGNPFDTDAEAFAKAVTDRMQRQHIGRPTNFTTTPGESAAELFRVVLVFNGELAGSPDPCSGGAYRPSAGDEIQITLEAAWCYGSNAESQVLGVASGIEGADDPAFRQLIAAVTLNLFPRRNPDEDRDDRDREYDRD